MPAQTGTFEEDILDRRQFITLAGGAAVAASSSIRAFAQSASGTVTYGQSTAVLTLDSASGAFTGYPAGYESGFMYLRSPARLRRRHEDRASSSPPRTR